MRGKDRSCHLLPPLLVMGTSLLPPGELCSPQLLLTHSSKGLSSLGTAPCHPRMCEVTGTSEHPCEGLSSLHPAHIPAHVNLSPSQNFSLGHLLPRVLHASPGTLLCPAHGSSGMMLSEDMETFTLTLLPRAGDDYMCMGARWQARLLEFDFQINHQPG